MFIHHPHSLFIYYLRSIIAAGTDTTTHHVVCVQVLVLDKTDTEIASLKDGDSFGEVALLGSKTMRRTATVLSSAYCDLDLFTKSDFEQLLNDFPDMRYCC